MKIFNEIIKKSKKAIKEGGLKLLFKRLFIVFVDKIKMFVHRIFRIYIIKKIKKFNKDSIEDVFNFSQNLIWEVIRPGQIKEEFCELLKIFKELKPKYILEIGTANGGSLFCFCKLAPDDATIISVDLPGGQFGGGYPEWKIPIYQAFAKENQKLYLLRMDSHKEETLEEVKKILGDNQLDFLFIDGDHSYEGVKKDFEMYGQLVRKGGVIAFHDIANPPDEFHKVHLFWNEIKNSFKFIEIIKDKNQKGYGIGVIIK